MSVEAGQGEIHNSQTGMVPYGPPMPFMTGGGDSLFQIAWRGKWFILLSTILGGVGAYIYLQRITPMYTSTARILVERHGGRSDLTTPQPIGSTSANYLQTQASMITSSQIITAAMRDPNVLTLPALQDPNYAQGVMRTLSATVGKNTDIIGVSASSPHPRDAAQVVNAIVSAYIGWHKVNRQLSTEDLLSKLNSDLEKRSEELRQKYKVRLIYEQRYPEVVSNATGGVESQTLDLLRQELARAHAEVIQQDSYYGGLQKLEPEPAKFRQYVYAFSQRISAAGETGDGERTRLKEELESIQLQLEAISAGRETTRLIQKTLLESRKTRIEERMAELDKEFVQHHLAVAKMLAEDARSREKQLAEAYENESTKTQNRGEQYSEYAFISSECTMVENMYNSLLNQINGLDLNARFEGLTIHVLERASPATQPSSPQMTRVMGIGLVLGLMVGAGLALLRDWRDQSIRSADEIAAILGVPVLGAVPSIPRRRLMGRRKQLLRFPRTRESEAFRAIRTALLFGAHREHGTAILITSPGSLEGKTTLVRNLGIVMAQTGQKTLILDADLRKPMQHWVLARNGHDRGLTDVLTGTATFSEAVQVTEFSGLDVLASGRSVPNPSELLNSQTFLSLLEQLKGSYDRILVDSSPVGLVTDAQILAAHISLTLLVLRAGRTTRPVTQRARDALQTVGARIAGAVVNDVSKRDRRYSHYSGVGYHYGYYGSNHNEIASQQASSDIASDRHEQAPASEKQT